MRWVINVAYMGNIIFALETLETEGKGSVSFLTTSYTLAL